MISSLPLLLLITLLIPSLANLPVSYGRVSFSSPLQTLSFPKRRVSVSTGKESKVNGEPSKYQYVGVAEDESSGKRGLSGLRWFKRKRSRSASPDTFDVRIVVPNRAAILRDLLISKNLDIYVKYVNSGKVDPDSGRPLITKVYEGRERKLTNMWNFNPINHVFKSNAGGSGRREKRLKGGVYTDGAGIFRRRYDRQKGVNEMERIGSLQDAIKSKSITEKMMSKLKEKVSAGRPDAVVENTLRY